MAERMHELKINLVEDDEYARTYLMEAIAQDDTLHLCDASADYNSGMAALKKHKPDILLTDLGLPDGSGVDLIKAIHELRLDTIALVVSGFQDEKTVFKALEAGASGYILKQDDSQTIVKAIHQTMGGGATVSPAIARLLLDRFHQPVVGELPEALTERQLNILKYVSQGFSSKEISQKLNISYHTVTTHIKNIYHKLQVNSRTEAIFEASRLGLLK